MTSATMNKIPVKSIRIEQAEGPTDRLVRATASSFEQANRYLTRIADMAPKDGSYYKTDVTITWEDGFSTQVREDVVHVSKAAPNLAEHVRRFWAFYAGFHRPDHIDPDRYDALVAENPKRRDDATEALKKYALEDIPQKAAPAPARSNPAPAPRPLPEEIEQMLVILGQRVKLLESQPNAGVFRSITMELRKAMAALIRARDMMKAQ